jgi:hypothetical protein
LKTVVEGYEHGHKGYKSFSRAYIALQKAVHLTPALHVGSYLVHHPLLCASKGKGKIVFVERVENLSDVFKDVSSVFSTMIAGVSKDIELHIEQFLEL